jgi:hypothetical protein
MIQGLGFGVQQRVLVSLAHRESPPSITRFGVWGLGFRVQGIRFGVTSVGFR